jgi:hypothetical protein
MNCRLVTLRNQFETIKASLEGHIKSLGGFCPSDTDGKPITGENKYVLHFIKDELPPVDAFWSLTPYDEEGLQVANPLNGSRSGIVIRSSLTQTAQSTMSSCPLLAPLRHRCGHRESPVTGVQRSRYAHYEVFSS